MSFSSIFKFKEEISIMHKFDPRIKLFLLISLSVVSIVIGNPIILLIIFLTTIFFWALLRPNYERMKGLFITYSIIGLGFMFSQGFFYYWEPKTILLVIIPSNFPVLGVVTGGINLYLEGIIYGAIQTLRILTTFNLSLLIISSTHPSKFLLSLNKMGVPFTLSFMVSTSIRFAPILMEEGGTIINAMKTRGKKIGGFHTFSTLKLLFFPLLVNSLRKAQQIAIAADCRAFRAKKERSFLKDLKITKKDYVLFIYSLVFLIIGIYLSFIGYGASVPGLGG